MKNQYVGDINDYIKYGLLRSLSADGDLRLGVWWMLTRGDGRSDGALTHYLDRPERWSPLDPALFSSMRSLIRGGTRSVDAVERSGILPGTMFWPPLVPDSRSQRQRTFTDMLHRFQDRDLVMFDPDMGIEVPSVPKGRARSSQYVYWEELLQTYHAGHSLMVFQYFPRMKRLQFVGVALERFSARLHPEGACCVWSPRVAFLCALHGRHRARLWSRLQLFAQRWQLPLMGNQPTGSCSPRMGAVDTSGRDGASVAVERTGMGLPRGHPTPEGADKTRHPG